MTKIAFILLCHKDPEAIVQQARQLTATGDCIAIHFDARAPRASFDRIRRALADEPGVTFARRRIRCGWGAWSLVAATLLAVEAAVEAFPRATHFYMVSGDCMAIKSARHAHGVLRSGDADYIESFDFFKSGWIRTGLREERLIYRHWFNERENKRLFYAAMALQRRLGLTRRPPRDITVMIGSQWWCLRRATVEAILRFVRDRPDVVRFFRTTWIPDETFFQTLVRHLVPAPQIESRTLTFLLFSDYGLPVNFYNDHYDLLLGQDYLFARKISPGATALKSRLGRLYASDRTDFPISGEGRALHGFLAGRGRIGRRFAPRFWEAGATLGEGRQLLILTCKKWHVGKRLLAAVRAETGIPAIAYLFDEEDTPLPHIGGIEGTLSKRTRHRRVLIRLLFDEHRTDRLLICLDTAQLDLLRDLCADGAAVRLLEAECELGDAFVSGHARRIGLAGPGTPPEALAQLVPALRNAILHESELIRAAGFSNFTRIRQTATAAENASALAQFLSLGEDAARRIATIPTLFDD